MTFFLLLLGGYILLHLRPVWRGMNPDYISREHTQTINGIFLILIFLSHFVGYIDSSGRLHAPYLFVQKFMMQLVVCTFLFYSGYGVALSLKTKNHYELTLLQKRIPQLWIQFACAVFLFALVSENGFTGSKLLRSLLAWDNLGNSCWYVFAILFLYFASFVAFSAFPANGGKDWRGAILLTVICILYCWIISKVRTRYWHDTIFCYVLGVYYAFIKEKIEAILFKQKYFYYLALFLAIITFLIMHRFWYEHTIFHQITACLFMCVVLLFTMKFHIHSKILKYVGDHVFSLYILQRIPMNLFYDTIIAKNFAIYCISCAAITLGMSLVFDHYMAKLLAILFKKQEIHIH